MAMNTSRLLVLAAMVAASSAQAGAEFTAPTPYYRAADNPITATFGYSHLEDFEDGLNTPGLSASGGQVASPSVFTDSVDADDGAVDGVGSSGHSWYSTGYLQYLDFSFSAAALGALPTQVGLAFTDIGNRIGGGIGLDTAVIEVFDGAGVSQGSLHFAFGDDTALSSVAEDRFVGARYAGGISAIRVGFEHSLDWEVDHVFYAGAVPEPGSWALMAAGLALLAGATRARRA
jgi:hypothetical protein